MLQSDALANEFNEILNAVEIFAPFQPLDPAVTFYAPLQTTVRDLRLNQDDFQRNSDAWYKDGSGIYRNVGINRARFEEGRLLMEPAKTNKCENFNFAPDAALTGLTRAGSNPAAVLSRVITDTPPELAVMNNGYAVEIDNRPGTGSATISVSGSVNSLGVHTLSAWVRVLDAVPSNTLMRTNDGSISIQLFNADWQRIEVSGTPGDTNNFFQIFCGAADRVRVQMIGNQLEESPAVTSPIVTEGTAGQRATDLLTYASANNYVNFAQGMILVTMQARADFDDLGDDYTTGIATLNDQTNRFFHMRRPASGNLSFRLADGTNLATSPAVTHSQGDMLYAAGRWAGAEMQVGFRRNDGAWLWNPAQPYAGSWLSNNLLTIARTAVHPWQYGELFIYDEDRGTAWIEANYP